MKLFSLLLTTILLQLSQLTKTAQMAYSEDQTLVDFKGIFGKPQDPAQCSVSFVQRIIPAEYPFETHTVVSEDGYYLTLIRMQAKGTTMRNGKPVVFLMHGLGNGAENYYQNGEEKALAFLLANAGFDVWLGNNRGSRFSRRHRTFSIYSKQFWNFSFDQLARYDLPAFLQYVNGVTGSRQIRYIGHSQGNTQMFAALSDPVIRPLVVPYIKEFHSLASIVFLNKNKVPVFSLGSYFIKQVQELAYKLGVNYLNLAGCGFNQTELNYWNSLCRSTPAKCYKQAKMQNIHPSAIDNWARAGYRHVMSHSGTSAMSMIHFGQLAKAQSSDQNVFPKYDYGAQGNQKFYGRPAPPSYDLSLITESVFLWAGTDDALSTPAEIAVLQSELKNARVTTHWLQGWGHETFCFAADNHVYYGQLIAQLRSN